MHLVTGGAGFIGSHLVRALNRRGIDDILIVDDLEHGDKFKNVHDCRIADYMNKGAFGRLLQTGELDLPITRIFHQGACTDTLERDGRYLMENNFGFSKRLLRFALEREVPFVYASSAAIYGGSQAFGEEPDNERPLNVYAYSKLVFDQHVRRQLPRARSTVVGLRYFNVYGPGEDHKGRMASMVHHVNRQVREDGVAKLFRGCGGFADGDQRRDFVFVEDVVNVNLFFAERSAARGIFNVGSGRSRSFNELARLTIAQQGAGRIDYIPMSPAVRGRYQTFTEADLTALRGAGYTEPFVPLEEGLARTYGPRRAGQAVA